jgi:NAD+ synthase
MDFEIQRIINFMEAQQRGAKAKGFVVGVSGGIDSAVVASLSQRAAGADNVVGVRMFEDYHRNSNDFLDAGNLIRQLKIRSVDILITPLIDSFQKTLEGSKTKTTKIVLANIKARARMTLLYSIANAEGLLVAGTGDRSEDLIGYFTKYGDGGVDLLPIAHLYKNQVRALGRALGVPETIVTKPSSPNLWEGHKATDELPADYDTLDEILTVLYDQNLGPVEASKQVGVPISLVDEIIQKNIGSKHKRNYPPMVESW